MYRIVFFVFALSSSTAFAQNLDCAKLDRYFDALEKHDMALGSVTIVQKDAIVYQRAFGCSPRTVGRKKIF